MSSSLCLMVSGLKSPTVTKPLFSCSTTTTTTTTTTRKRPLFNSNNTLFFLLKPTSLTTTTSTSTTLTTTRTGTRRRKLNGGICRCQLVDLAPSTSAAYGLLLLSGGLFAFNRSGSKGSLFGGLTGAALMATAYFLMQNPETKKIGDALGFGSAFLFASVFGIRLAATRKLTPSGPLLGLSICALIVFILSYLQDNV